MVHTLQAHRPEMQCLPQASLHCPLGPLGLAPSSMLRIVAHRSSKSWSAGDNAAVSHPSAEQPGVAEHVHAQVLAHNTAVQKPASIHFKPGFLKRTKRKFDLYASVAPVETAAERRLFCLLYFAPRSSSRPNWEKMAMKWNEHAMQSNDQKRIDIRHKLPYLLEQFERSRKT